MKTIFKEITAQLDTVPGLNWIDEDKGQMNFERPPVLFPCALVSLSLPQTQNYNQDNQQCDLQVSVTLAFDFSGNTNNLTPEADRERSLAYYDMVDLVYKSLQGFSSVNFNKLERRNFRPIPRPDQYKTVNMTFTSEFIED